MGCGREVIENQEALSQVCETLDRRKGLTESILWPLPPPPPEDEEQEQDAEGSGAEALDADAWENLPPATRLADVLQWLRSEYFYCVFCGSQVRTAVQAAYAFACAFCLPKEVDHRGLRA